MLSHKISNILWGGSLGCKHPLNFFWSLWNSSTVTMLKSMHLWCFVSKQSKNTRIYFAFAKARALTKKKNSRSRCDAVLKAILHMSRSKRKKRAFACACWRSACILCTLLYYEAGTASISRSCFHTPDLEILEKHSKKKSLMPIKHSSGAVQTFILLYATAQNKQN